MSIAHLSDIHLLDTRPALARSVLERGMRLASLGRAPDSKARIQRLTAGIAAARDAGAVHLVISGDLTEMGTPEQLETLASVLEGTRVDPDRVTLVPGNHDAYTRSDAWARALAGPLKRFRRAAAVDGGSVVERAKVFLLPLDVACHQQFPRAAGELTPRAADALERRVQDLSGRGKPLVIVLHHSPFAHTPRAWDVLHGLRGGQRILELLSRYPDLHVLHGHLHREVEVSVDPRRPRVFGAPAVIDDLAHCPRVKLYEVAGSSLRSLAGAAPATTSTGPLPPAPKSHRTLAA